MNIHVINGPNLNLLGKREPDIYGADTLDDIEGELRLYAEKLNGKEITLGFYQSNVEGEIINRLHEIFAEQTEQAGVILNAGAFTHYSYAIRDAIAAVKSRVTVVEVHLSNVHSREEFRHKSVISAVCKGVIAGFGKQSYFLALAALAG